MTKPRTYFLEFLSLMTDELSDMGFRFFKTDPRSVSKSDGLERTLFYFTSKWNLFDEICGFQLSVSVSSIELKKLYKKLGVPLSGRFSFPRFYDIKVIGERDWNLYDEDVSPSSLAALLKEFVYPFLVQSDEFFKKPSTSFLSSAGFSEEGLIAIAALRDDINLVRDTVSYAVKNKGVLVQDVIRDYEIYSNGLNKFDVTLSQSIARSLVRLGVDVNEAVAN